MLFDLIRAGQTQEKWKPLNYFRCVQKGLLTMINTFVYVQTIIDWTKMEQNFGNVFGYVNERPYRDKKGVLPDGVTVTLNIIKDDGDYGIDKNTGKPRSTNRGQNFDVTILNGKTSTDFQFGDKVSLVGFDPEHSYAVGFDLLLRFKDIKKAQPMTAQPARQPLTKGV